MSEINSSDDAPIRKPTVSRMGIVGLGLMGGSIAHATRARVTGVEIIGVDRQMILDVAQDKKIIDAGAEPADAVELLRNCDLVVLCLPVMGIIETLEKIGPTLKNGPVITDAGSTKCTIAEKARELGLERFVGGHPMAGKAEGGLAHADPDLLKGATWFVCPTEGTDPQAAGLLRQWVRELGSHPVEISPEEHDRAVALTSHFPHIIVNLLAETVLEEGVLEAAGGTLHNVLGVAGAPFNIWGDTLRTNQPAVLDSMRQFSAKLAQLADDLEDADRLRDLFARGRECRERMRG
jgi:prephenate dehydrogenase